MKKEAGSAHIIVIVVLVIALVASLGWIFWQNFVQTDTPKKQELTAQTDTTQEKTPTAEEKPLELKEWAVSIPLTEADSDFSVKMSDDDYYIVSSSKANPGCEGEHKHSIGSVSRFVADEKSEKGSLLDGATPREVFKDNNNAVIIGKYVYHYSRPQSLCADVTEDEGKAINDAIRRFTKAFIQLKTND